jgi:hypothetical protein
MKIGGEDIENFIMNMVLEKIFLKDTNIKKHFSMLLH